MPFESRRHSKELANGIELLSNYIFCYNIGFSLKAFKVRIAKLESFNCLEYSKALEILPNSLKLAFEYLQLILVPKLYEGRPSLKVSFYLSFIFLK